MYEKNFQADEKVGIIVRKKFHLDRINSLKCIVTYLDLDNFQMSDWVIADIVHSVFLSN